MTEQKRTEYKRGSMALTVFNIDPSHVPSTVDINNYSEILAWRRRVCNGKVR